MRPDAKHRITDPKLLADLIEASGLTIKATAARIGVPYSAMRYWLAGDRLWPYTAQFAIECLAAGLELQASPDATQARRDADYLRCLVDGTKLKRQAVAERLGIDYSTLKRWLTTDGRPAKWPYSAQYALERMKV